MQGAHASTPLSPAPRGITLSEQEITLNEQGVTLSGVEGRRGNTADGCPSALLAPPKAGLFTMPSRLMMWDVRLVMGEKL